MKTIPVKIKRLWEGKATLRSYQVEEAIKKGAKLLIECDGEKMLISPHKGYYTGQVFESKFEGLYQLVDFPFESNTPRLL